MRWLKNDEIEILVAPGEIITYQSAFGDVKIISHPLLDLPTERQLTLSRLTGRSPEDFIR